MSSGAMRVLIACEFSGVVRYEFAKRGHRAMSCDLMVSDRSGRHHVGDVLDVLDRGWDLMIAFPPCTHLASSGARWFAEKRADGRQQAGIDFFMALINAPIPRICVENPVGIISTQYRKPDQIIQPYQFGHAESKATCLWLKGLPLLRPTKVVEPEYYTLPDGQVYRDKKGKRYSKTHYFSGRMQARWRNQTASGQNKLGLSPDRARIRSLTYQGIADAMADQWSTPTASYPLFAASTGTEESEDRHHG